MAFRVLQGEGTNRIEAISDGVFAIVLTLLVLQFDVPTIPSARVGTELLPRLLELRPLLFSYLLSFLTVGLYWVVHQNLFQHIEEHDRLLLYLNLLFLLTVSFLPFPTELLGTYGTRLTWGLYAANVTFVGVSLTLTWWYAIRRGLTNETLNDRQANLIVLRGLTIPGVFVLSIAVSFFDLTLAYWTPLLIIPAQVVWMRMYHSLDVEDG